MIIIIVVNDLVACGGSRDTPISIDYFIDFFKVAERFNRVLRRRMGPQNKASDFNCFSRRVL